MAFSPGYGHCIHPAANERLGGKLNVGKGTCIYSPTSCTIPAVWGHNHNSREYCGHERGVARKLR